VDPNTYQTSHNKLDFKLIFVRVQFCVFTAEVHTTLVAGRRGDYIFTVRPNIFGYSVRNLLYVTLPVPRILRWLLDFWKICAILFN